MVILTAVLVFAILRIIRRLRGPPALRCLGSLCGSRHEYGPRRSFVKVTFRNACLGTIPVLPASLPYCNVLSTQKASHIGHRDGIAFKAIFSPGNVAITSFLTRLELRRVNLEGDHTNNLPAINLPQEQEERLRAQQRTKRQMTGTQSLIKSKTRDGKDVYFDLNGSHGGQQKNKSQETNGE
ncbi:MAG: hypothetical protein Q9174_006402 [Haloplaca sp. 1 TL-2023]